MKKSTILVISLVLAFQLCHSQKPYTIIKFDSSIRMVVDAVKLNESEFIIVGNSKYIQGQHPNIFIAQINTNGEILWKKEHKGYMKWYCSVCAKLDGNYYITMGDTTGAAVLIETEHAGDSLWSFISTEPEINTKCFGSIKEFPDGKFVLIEAIHSNMCPFLVDESNYYIMNPDGTINLKFNALNREVYDIEVVSEKDFIAAESAKNGIIKYNINGQILTIDSCAEFINSDYYLWELNNTTGNQFYATGHISDYPDNYGLLSKIDKYGQIEYCSADTSIDYFQGIAQTEGGDIIYYGMKDDHKMIIGEMTSPGIFLPKIEIDSIYMGSNISISDDHLFIFVEFFGSQATAGVIKIPVDSIVSSIDDLNYGSLKTYPNPANDYVVFEIHRYRAMRQEIIITNSLGQQIAILPVKSKKTVWDTSKIKSGVYFYAFNSEGTIINGKIVINK